MSERPSGWYDDPENPDQLRYWDGILWSDRTMPKVKPNLEQSRIGDARQQYEEEQERRRLAEQAQAGGRPQQPPLRPYQAPQQGQQNPYQQQPPQRPYGAQPYPPRPVKTTPDGEPTAPWWRRLVAYVIDNLLLSAVAVAITWKWLDPWVSKITDWYRDVLDAASNGQQQPPIPNDFYHVPWQFPVVTAVLYLVYEIALIAWRGQTIGHLVCGIRVRGASSTARPPLQSVVVRAIVKGVSNLTTLVPFLGSLGSLFSLVDGLVPLGDRSSQSLHDKAAKTYVVRANPKQPQQVSPPYSGQ